MVAVAVLAVVVAMFSSIFLLMQRYWFKQKAVIEMVQNMRWAMDLMCAEARHGSRTSSPVGGMTLISFSWQNGMMRFWRDMEGDAVYDAGDDTRVRYWRGNRRAANPYDTSADATSSGDDRYLYRTISWNYNYSLRRRVAQGLVDNPSNRDNFRSGANGTILIELTSRPEPLEPEGQGSWNYGNRNFTVRTCVRARTD